MHGQFVWYELMTPDAAGAKKFYPMVTGWSTEAWKGGASDYTMWTSGGIPLGGIVQFRPDQLEQGMRPSWMPYIEANDVDATARQAAAIGGRVLFGPQDIPGTGRFAVLGDPQGAVFAIYKSLSPSEAFDGEPIVGHFSWHELLTTDADAAFEFYRRLFGWEKTGDFDMGPAGMYQMYGRSGRRYGGIFNRSEEMGNVAPYWTCYVNVRDVDAAVAAVKKAGGTVMYGPIEVPGGDWVAGVLDPQRAAFALHQVGPRTAGRPAKAKRASTPGKKRKSKTARRPAKSRAKPPAKRAAKRAKPKAKASARTSARRTTTKKPKRRGR